MADQAGGNGVRRPPAVATAPNSASAFGAVTLGADESVPKVASRSYEERVLSINLAAEFIYNAEEHPGGVWVRPELTLSQAVERDLTDGQLYVTWFQLRKKELRNARASLASTSAPTTMTNPPSSSANDSKSIVPLSSTAAPASASTAIVAPSAPMTAATANPASFQSAYSSSGRGAGRPRLLSPRLPDDGDDDAYSAGGPARKRVRFRHSDMYIFAG